MLATILLVLLGAAIGAAAVGLSWLLERQGTAAHLARLEAERDGAIRAVDEQRVILTQTQDQLRDAFSALSRSALKDNRDDFLHGADALMKPVRESLDRVQRQLAEVDKAREGSYRDVASQLGTLRQSQEQLRVAAEDLTRSLRSPNVRGRWGEHQLRRIVELAGMVEQCDFVEKESTTSADGARQTPDLIVKLPGDANIIVDAKVPIDAYLSATNATSDRERQGFLQAHARQVRDHVRALGQKDYSRQFQPAPDFVIMFLPLEPLMSAAFEQDANLFEYAAGLRVIPATPLTLLALLRTIASGWRQQQVTRNAEEIQQIGRELYERLATMVDHLEDVGHHIRDAADSYNSFVGSLEHKVLPGARRFKELGVSSSKDLAQPEPLRLTIRPVTKDELTTRDDDMPSALKAVKKLS